MRNGTANCCSVIGSVAVVVWAIYNRYRNAAQSNERRKVVRREALVIGGIFDSRKLIAAILARQSTHSLNETESRMRLQGREMGSRDGLVRESVVSTISRF